MESKNVFEPFKGINEISFGMERNEIRKVLGQEYQTFRRNEFAENTSDYYSTLNLFVEYDEYDVCEAIEFTNESNLYFEGSDILKMDYKELINHYGSRSKEMEVEEDISVTFYDLGFGATKSENGKIETIIIFSRTYWQ